MVRPNLRRVKKRIRDFMDLVSVEDIFVGMTHYEQAHSFAKILHVVYGAPSIRHAAGILSALSPLNGWERNQIDALVVCGVETTVPVVQGNKDNRQIILFDNERENKEIQLPKKLPVCNTSINYEKATRIYDGEDPEVVLGGRKVITLYECFADLSVRNRVPIDRHLVRVAVGSQISEAEISKMVSKWYDLFENAYLDVGKWFRMGNRLASVVWAAQRRLRDTKQMVVLQYDINDHIRELHGQKMPAMHIGKIIGKSYPATKERLLKMGIKPILIPKRKSKNKHGYRQNDRGYWRWSPPAGDHRRKYVNGSGWQYVHRIAAGEWLGRRLEAYEQVHHKEGSFPRDDGNWSIDELVEIFEDRYEILEDTHHGEYHASGRKRGEDGRFLKTKYHELVHKTVSKEDLWYPSDWNEVKHEDKEFPC